LKAFSPDFPFAPRRLPIFYGWVVLVVSALGMVASIPGQTMGVSVFTDHLIAATGVSRLTLSNTYLVGTMLSGLLLPLAGAALDRLGARVMSLLAAMVLATTLLFLSSVDQLAGTVARRLGASASTVPVVLLLAFGFTALRFSGQGVLTLTSRTMLGKWFERRRGLVAGVGGVVVSFAFGSAPLLLSSAIGVAGWRGAWRGLAVALAVGMGLTAWLLFRDNPEECGLVMDGLETRPDERPAPHPETAERPVAAPPRAFSRGEALRTSAFWAVTLALALHGMLVTGITFHIVDLGVESGLAERAVVSLFLPMAILGTIVQLVAGIVSDRVDIKWLVVAMMALETMGIIAMAHLGDPRWRSLAVIGMGCGGGFFGPLSTVAFPRYFGRVHLGAIGGAQMMVTVLATAVGPALLALARQSLGTYSPALYASAGLTVMVLFVGLRSRNP